MADFGVASLVVAADLAPVEETWDDIPLDGSVLFGAVPTPDVVAPVVGNFSPALGSSIAANQPISFDVTDNEGLFTRVIIHARFADGSEEVVYNGDSFRGLYSGGASWFAIIALGLRFTIFRTGGWTAGSPIAVNVFAYDVAGNEAA